MGGLLGRLGQEVGLVLIVGVAMVLIAVPVVLVRINRGKPVLPAIWQTALEVAILGSIAGIVALTLGLFAYGGPGGFNMVPFKSLADSFAYGEFWVEIAFNDLAANFLLYVPLGFLVALRFGRMSIWMWAPTVFALTAGIELVQGVVLNRSADIDDVLMNGFGGVAGFLAARGIQCLTSLRRVGNQP